MLGVSAYKAHHRPCEIPFWILLLGASSVLIAGGCKHALRMHEEFLWRNQRQAVPTGSPTRLEGDNSLALATIGKPIEEEKSPQGSPKTPATESAQESKKNKGPLESWEFFSSKKESLKLVACAYGAGAVAALCGIGGGMLLGPLMLKMGLRPQISTATTATTLFMLSTTASVIFLVGGAAPLEHAFIFAAVCACGALGGKKIISDYVRRTGRNSLLALLLGVLIAFSTVLLPILGVTDLIQTLKAAYSENDPHAKRMLWFRPLCDKEPTTIPAV